jgi:hypothetical protein
MEMLKKRKTRKEVSRKVRRFVLFFASLIATIIYPQTGTSLQSLCLLASKNEAFVK